MQKKNGRSLGIPQAAPVFDSPVISTFQRKEKTINTRKIFTLLVLIALLVTILAACGAGGASSDRADPCPDAVCFLARMLDILIKNRFCEKRIVG